MSRRYEDIAGSGRIRVTTPGDVSRALVKREAMIERVEPLEGTRMSLWNTQIPSFWQETYGTAWYGTPDLAERVWVAFRCQQLNSQQIASMPLRYHGPGTEPEWVASPDPNWYPNGIGDALHAIVNQLYGWGFSCQYITDRYATGYPRTWTVLPSAAMQIKVEDGRRVYKLGEQELDPDRIIHIDRNPTTAVHGTSALYAYAQAAWGLLAAGNQSASVSAGGVPQALLKPTQRVTKEQADEILAGWSRAAATRGNLPAIIPPNLEYEQLSFNPSDMALLETQEWNARVLATAYGVPSVILNMALQGGLTYQNPIALMQMWWLTELRTKAKQITDAFSSPKMLPRGQWVEIDATDITTGPVESSDDPQAAVESVPNVAKASPAQQPLAVVTGGGQP